ncbi:hypothetical protein [Anaerosporobacter sp.]|uniref:hypothetical protein n=1 Tax=Anaerosporobacter sp. TaxID=1872529 RepID=UPI00286F3855|nr:hypothetical protein [Anaerosporobacter sp.]
MFVKGRMSKVSRWKVKNIVLLILVILCYITAVRKYYELQENYQSVSVRLQGEAVTKEQVEMIPQTEELPEITAYEMEEHRTIMDTRYEKSKDITKYLTYGNMAQILPLQICRGNYVYEEDYEGCILDKGTAYELFGSLDIIGQSIIMEETDSDSSQLYGEQIAGTKQQEYYIRGILDTSYPIVMIQSREEKTTFHYLQLDYGNSSRGREYAEQLVMTYSLGSSFIIVDQNLIVRLLGNLLFLPWLIGGTAVIWKVIHLSLLMRKVIPCICAIMGIVITAKEFAFFPLQYVPTKWSDFNSARRIIDAIHNHIEEFRYLSPTIREVMFKDNIIMLLFTVMIILILMPLTNKLDNYIIKPKR